MKINTTLLVIIITLGIAGLSYLSYLTGYKTSKSDMDSLLMTMTLDSNFVTAGLYEEMPNNVRRTLQFFLEDTPTMVNGVKIFAEVKYVTIGGELYNIENGNIWKIIKKEKVFQRKFDNPTSENKENIIPNSPFADNKKITNK